MIFDAKEFEHFVDEQSLKKGYRLFEKGLPELEKASAPEYRFHIGNEEISIRKRGDKILSYSCTCRKQRSCEHLGAAMFYLQRAALHLPKPAQKRALNTEKKAEPFSLRQKSAYDACSSAICEILRPYVSSGKLDAGQVNDVHAKIASFVSSTIHSSERDLHLCILLAAYAESAPVFALRFVDDNTVLKDWHSGIASRLSNAFRKGLRGAAREAWLMATLRALRSDKCLESDAFAFLLPRYLVSHPTRNGMELLCQLIEKRKQKTGYVRRISHLLVAAIQLFIKMQGSSALPFRYRKFAAECAIAQAELEFAAGRDEKALGRLESSIASVREHQPHCIQEFTSIVIARAAACHKKEMEIRLRRDALLRAMFIRQDELDQLLRLYPLHRRQSAIEWLLSDMKHPPAVNTFDKIAALLMANNRVDQLVKELQSADSNLSLLNEVALKNATTTRDEGFVSLYATRLSRALNAAASIPHQMKIFGNAREFLQKLPSPLSDKAAEILVAQTGEHTKIGSHIRSFFRFSRIHLN